MDLVKINNFEIIVNENNFKVLKLYYEFFGNKETKLKISVTDTIFKTVTITALNSVSFGAFWTTFSTSAHPSCNTLFSMGIDVIIVNDESKEIIHEETIPFIITDFKKRSLNSLYSHSIPNFWVIGDSHVGNIFQNVENKQLICGNFLINNISQPMLSLNRFISSDWKSFFKTILIKDNDIISFLFGDIDLRASIIWATNHITNIEQKRNNFIIILNKTLTKYLNVINELKLLYPKCKIVILTPNTPIKSGVLSQDDLNIGSDEDRLFLWKQFDSFFKNEVSLKNIDYYWNCIEDYVDDDGFMKKEHLKNNDNHVDNGMFFIESLKNKIIQNFIEDFQFLYDKNENKLKISTIGELKVKVSILNNNDIIYSTISNFNNNRLWYIPSVNLYDINNIKIEIRDMNDNIIKEECMTLQN